MVHKASTPKKTTKRAAPKSAPKSPAATATAPPLADPVKVLGKRELIAQVVAASGVKKKAAKPVVEAMLKILGDALSQGETLNLQPFGKGIVKNRKELDNAEIVELRLRRSKQAIRAAEAGAADADSATDPAPGDPLAEAAE